VRELERKKEQSTCRRREEVWFRRKKKKSRLICDRWEEERERHGAQKEEGQGRPVLESAPSIEREEDLGDELLGKRGRPTARACSTEKKVFVAAL